MKMDYLPFFPKTLGLFLRLYKILYGSIWLTDSYGNKLLLRSHSALKITRKMTLQETYFFKAPNNHILAKPNNL